MEGSAKAKPEATGDPVQADSKWQVGMGLVAEWGEVGEQL